jgi:hypothetical protein
MQNQDNFSKSTHKLSSKTSSVSAKLEFLNTAIEGQLHDFQLKRYRNRRKAFFIRVFISIFGVGITVLLGIQVTGLKQLLSNIALILSGTITILNSLDSFYNYRSLWIRYTITTNQLHSVKADIDYLLAGGMDTINEEDVDKLYYKYKGILEETNEEWVEMRKEKNKGRVEGVRTSQ